MILTQKNIRDLSHSGGFTKAQLKLLGVSWPPQSGWIMARVGTEISEELYVKILKLRSKSKPKQEKRDHANPHTYFALVRATKEPTPAVCVTMQVPVQLVETVQGLIRLLESLRPRS